ncbi:hypothetical protein ARMGADRAFT_1037772 [Armillaria gallica]|uniref:Uncharacterized protein n=1 Tax=Armillaria gallica TaxID=47427 RepID=A0A2H3CWN5_ARMGA|nr:hypothetical protein ARMGADRAFT_1037772 [Armillaria gallica]
MMHQSNTVDMSRRSPSYENCLAKFAARGYEIRVPTLKRDNVNLKIYSLCPSHLHGLALLLYLENQMVLETRKLHSPSGDHIHGIHTQVVDKAIVPGWTANKIESHILNADFVLNSETMQGVYNSYKGDGWQLH